MPKPSRLPLANPSPAPASPGVAAVSGGSTVQVELNPSGLPAPVPSHVAAAAGRASVEVRTKPGRRRSFPASEKLRIVREAAACTKPGQVGALLRREGIYSSLLTAWRKELKLHGSAGLAGRKPGRKPTLDAKDRRIADLEKRAVQLEAKLSLAEKLIDLQKKVSAILGLSLTTDEET